MCIWVICCFLCMCTFVCHWMCTLVTALLIVRQLLSDGADQFLYCGTAVRVLLPSVIQSMDRKPSSASMLEGEMLRSLSPVLDKHRLHGLGLA